VSDWATYAAGISGTIVGVAATLLVDRLGADEREESRRIEAVRAAIDSVKRQAEAMIEHRGSDAYPSSLVVLLIDANNDIAALRLWGAPDDLITKLEAAQASIDADASVTDIGAAVGTVIGLLTRWLVESRRKRAWWRRS
jgi:hypothetical protein